MFNANPNIGVLNPLEAKVNYFIYSIQLNLFYRCKNNKTIAIVIKRNKKKDKHMKTINGYKLFIIQS